MAEEITDIDPLDRRILDELLTDGRITYQDLAARVHLAATTTAERVRRLERRGVIRGYRALVDWESLGRPLEALIDVRLAPGVGAARFEETMRTRPEIVDAVHLTGRADYHLRVRCGGTVDLDGLLGWLKADAGVVESETRVILRRVDLGRA